MAENEKKQLYVKNEHRKFNNLKSAHLKNFQPEYERLNREPIPVDNISLDFMNKPKKKFSLNVKPESPESVSVPVMADQEHAWLPPPVEPEPEPEPRTKLPNPFQHSVQPAEGSQLSEVQEGEICIVINGKLSFASYDAEEIEHCIQNLVFGQNPVPLEEISVFKRLGVGIGAFLKGK